MAMYQANPTKDTEVACVPYILARYYSALVSQIFEDESTSGRGASGFVSLVVLL
jgi:hypothetical protein